MRITPPPPLQFAPPRPGERHDCALIVLAAGAARRAGRPKALARHPDGRTLIAVTLDALAAAALRGPRIVVLGCEAAAVDAAIGDRPFRRVVCADWQDGMAASLGAGIAALPRDTGAAMIALGDMPHADAGLLAALLACRDGEAARIVAPVHGGRRGHPVIWGAAHFAALRDLRGDTGGREVIAARHAHLTEIPAGPDCLVDYDLPEALAAFERQGRAR